MRQRSQDDEIARRSGLGRRISYHRAYRALPLAVFVYLLPLLFILAVVALTLRTHHGWWPVVLSACPPASTSSRCGARSSRPCPRGASAAVPLVGNRNNAMGLNSPDTKGAAGQSSMQPCLGFRCRQSFRKSNRRVQTPAAAERDHRRAAA